MNHALLYGSHEVTIDQKNRLPIPVEFRRSINLERDGDAFFIIVGINRRPWFYPDRYYMGLVSSQPAPELIPDVESLEFDHMYFGSAYRRTMDDQGRILVPERLLTRTGSEREVTMVGVKDHLELWNRSDYEAWEEDLDNRRVEIAKRVKRPRPPVAEISDP